MLHRAETKKHVVSTTNDKTLVNPRGPKNQRGHPHNSENDFHKQEILKNRKKCFLKTAVRHSAEKP